MFREAFCISLQSHRNDSQVSVWFVRATRRTFTLLSCEEVVLRRLPLCFEIDFHTTDKLSEVSSYFSYYFNWSCEVFLQVFFQSVTTIPSAVYGCADDETNVPFIQLVERDLRIVS